MIEKVNCAKKAIEFIEDGMVIGLGSGTTVRVFVEMLAEKVREGLDVAVIPSSIDSHMLAAERGLTVMSLLECPEPDLCVDGADQVDSEFNLIKGGGGALTREKIVASASKKFYVIVDESKMVERLNMPVPVEILEFAYGFVNRKIGEMGYALKLREGKGKLRPVISDNGNLIADVDAGVIENPEDLERELKIPGIVENGIFLAEMVNGVIVGKKDGAEVLKR
ncbi:ribose-5-phosphate isomerase RpiA [Geoglobus acetivorans]|uniref:Ribose-5-phosphate isomerase A n=1 Tax=Geoglobus acetivorans TaxID=565033 RepID=A0ABZ3H5J3_GEOAI|nr:ribose-5-phosphate isomerase RpiA [Geoglobus acetivorans]